MCPKSPTTHYNIQNQLNFLKRNFTYISECLSMKKLPCAAMAVADLRGSTRDARPPRGGQNSFNSMYFLGRNSKNSSCGNLSTISSLRGCNFNAMYSLSKSVKIVCWRLPLGSWRPLLREILDLLTFGESKSGVVASIVPSTGLSSLIGSYSRYIYLCLKWK